MPEVNTGAINAGLMDIALHPRFAENRLIYFTYSKPKPGGPFEDFQGMRDAATVTLARARFDGGARWPTSRTSSSPTPGRRARPDRASPSGATAGSS